MSARPTISTLPAGGRYSVSTLNSNLQALRDHFDTVMGRAGTGGANNTMTGDLDMNGNDIRNVDNIVFSDADSFIKDTDFGTNGLINRTASGTYGARTLQGGTGIDMTNGDGVSGNPSIAIDSTVLTSASAVTVPQGGTGATSLTDGGVLLGSGTGAVTAMGVLADGELIVGDGTTDPVAESGATLRTSLGLGTSDNVTHAIITGTTIEATGDTSAADNAAIGYTSSEGIIVTGQGSSNDVTIKNDADAVVAKVLTGTTTMTFPGDIDVDGTTNFDSLVGTTGATITEFADEDNFSSNSSTKGATQQSIKAYVDALVSANGGNWKASVINATTANISLTGEQTIDGVLTSTSRILVKNQSSASENGIYVTDASTWARAADFDLWDETVSGAVFVNTGSTLADTSWISTNNAGGTLDSTNIVFTQFGQGTLNNVVDDTSPQLGADLDANSYDIAFDDATGIRDESDNEQLIFQTTASAVNYVELTNAATGNAPIFSAAGSDTDVGIAYTTQADGVHTFTGGTNTTQTALSSSGNSIATDFADSDHYTHTFTENTTLANPTNIAVGKTGTIFFTQHASSPKTLGFGTYWYFTADPTITASNSALDRIDFTVRSTTVIDAVATLNLVT
jgi:hypothetical protein